MAKKSTVKKKCLVCGDSKPGGSRGLCTKHHQQFLRHRNTLTEEAAQIWESKLVEDGKLQADARTKKSENNAFTEHFETFVAENPGSYKTALEQVQQISFFRATSDLIPLVIVAAIVMALWQWWWG